MLFLGETQHVFDGHLADTIYVLNSVQCMHLHTAWAVEKESHSKSLGRSIWCGVQ